MKATFSSSISANLGNSGEEKVEIHKYLLGQAMKTRPIGHYKKYTLQGERHCTYYQQKGGELYH